MRVIVSSPLEERQLPLGGAGPTRLEQGSGQADAPLSFSGMARCTVCGSETRVLGGRGAAFPLSLCPRCGHRFAEVGGYDLSRAYGEDYDGFRPDLRFEESLRAFFRAHVVPRAPEGKLLDVGCGAGTALRIAGEFGFDALGFDVSQAAADACVAKGLRAVAGDFVRHDFGDSRFRMVTFWDVLEHLPDPAGAVRRSFELLEPGGWFLAKVPLHGKLSVIASGLVPRLAAPVLAVPEHVQFFTRQSLDTLLGARFTQKRWIELEAMRTPSTGGGLRRRFARRVVRAIQTASGDANLVVIAQRPRSAAEAKSRAPV
jgi:SAM-dependent methyltransferase